MESTSIFQHILEKKSHLLLYIVLLVEVPLFLLMFIRQGGLLLQPIKHGATKIKTTRILLVQTIKHQLFEYKSLMVTEPRLQV